MLVIKDNQKQWKENNTVSEYQGQVLKIENKKKLSFLPFSKTLGPRGKFVKLSDKAKL